MADSIVKTIEAKVKPLNGVWYGVTETLNLFGVRDHGGAVFYFLNFKTKFPEADKLTHYENRTAYMKMPDLLAVVATLKNQDGYKAAEELRAYVASQKAQAKPGEKPASGDVESSSSNGEEEEEEDSDEEYTEEDGVRKAKRARCRKDGCGKHRQGRCEGYCRQHFREKEAKAEADLDLEPDEPKDKRACKKDGCEKWGRGTHKGYCMAHYKEMETGEPADKPEPKRVKMGSDGHKRALCKQDGCTRFGQSKCQGYCVTHGKELKEGKLAEPLSQKDKRRIRDKCQWEGGCDKYRKIKGLCKAHAQEKEKGPKREAKPKHKFEPQVNNKRKYFGCKQGGCNEWGQQRYDGYCENHYFFKVEEPEDGKNRAKKQKKVSFPWTLALNRIREQQQQVRFDDEELFEELVNVVKGQDDGEMDEKHPVADEFTRWLEEEKAKAIEKERARETAERARQMLEQKSQPVVLPGRLIFSPNGEISFAAADLTYC